MSRGGGSGLSAVPPLFSQLEMSTAVGGPAARIAKPNTSGRTASDNHVDEFGKCR